MTLEKCPLCDATALTSAVVGKTQVYKCTNCSVVASLPSAVQPTSYYEQNYTLTSSVRNSTEFHRYFRYPEYQHLVGLLMAKAKPPSTLLDIGCDYGYFLDDARRYGYTVYGVEPSERGRGYAHSIGLDVVPTLEEVVQSADVATLWHVLEHVADPRTFLTSVRSRIKPGGWLFVRVPDFGSIPARLLRDKWVWFQPHHHAIHYTQQSLRSILELSGFSVVTLQTRRPNTRLTKKAYHLATAVMHQELGLQHPGLRGLAARWYQDITGVELLAIARYKD